MILESRWKAALVALPRNSCTVDLESGHFLSPRCANELKTTQCWGLLTCLLCLFDLYCRQPPSLARVRSLTLEVDSRQNKDSLPVLDSPGNLQTLAEVDRLVDEITPPFIHTTVHRGTICPR